MLFRIDVHPKQTKIISVGHSHSLYAYVYWECIAERQAGCEWNRGCRRNSFRNDSEHISHERDRFWILHAACTALAAGEGSASRKKFSQALWQTVRSRHRSHIYSLRENRREYRIKCTRRLIAKNFNYLSRQPTWQSFNNAPSNARARTQPKSV